MAPGMEPWLEAFPALASLTIDATQVRFHDRRVWDHEFRFQRFGVDYSAADLASFVSACLAPGAPGIEGGPVVINVRRGDYYTGDAAQRFGFDQVAYVAAALEIAAVGRGDAVRVVSDDPEWCRAALGPVLEGIAGSVSFEATEQVRNFRAVAGANLIIGSNSTFSYWAAHVATARDPKALVIMPAFHARLSGGTDAYQLDPRWIALDGFH